MADVGYKIRVRNGDQEVEVCGDKEFVLSKFAELTKHRPEDELKVSKTPRPIRKDHLSLVEFVKTKNPKSHSDRVIVFAYFLTKQRKMESYTAEDIANCYAEARIAKSKNINTEMNANVARAYLMPVEQKEGKKAWVITQTGEAYVVGGLKEIS